MARNRDGIFRNNMAGSHQSTIIGAWLRHLKVRLITTCVVACSTGGIQQPGDVLKQYYVLHIPPVL